MLPTSPRADERSMCNSWTTPCSSMATRVSCGVTLIRISWLIAVRSQHGKADACQDLGHLEQRQPHHPRIAALQVLNERSGLALDGVTAGLVERLAGRDVTLDLVVRDCAKGHVRSRHGLRNLSLPADGDRRDDVMSAPG